MEEVLLAVVVTYRNNVSRLVMLAASRLEDAAKAAVDRLGFEPGMSIDVHVVGESDRALCAAYDRKALAKEWWDRAIDCRGSSADDTSDNYFEVTWAEENA